MKQTLLTLLSLAAISTSHAAVIFSDVFSGSGGLNGTTTDVGGGVWEANAAFSADGSVTAGASAWLEYTFGTGIYEVTASINSNSGIVGIGFSTLNPSIEGKETGSLVDNGDSIYATLGLRSNGSTTIWGGPSNGNWVIAANSQPATGTLRMVLNTAGASWTVDGYFTAVGGTEVQLDLNGAGTGYTYTYETNPPGFNAVGLVTNSAGGYSNFTFSSVPEPAVASLLLGGALLLGLRRRRVQA